MLEDYPRSLLDRSLLDLEQRFASEKQCHEYLSALRWPQGVICPHCGGRKVWAMQGSRWLCSGCRHQIRATAGTIFQDTHQSLRVWLRLIWQLTSQKSGASALGLQRVLGLGSYQTAWTMLHKLRRAMVRPGRDRLSGRVEVDETQIGSATPGRSGRGSPSKTLVIIAAQEVGRGIGRIRMARIPDGGGPSVQAFILNAIELKSHVHTDGWKSYYGLKALGYEHQISKLDGQRPEAAAQMLPRVHLVASLLKRWLLGTHQGAINPKHLDYYLDEFTFRFNRRNSASRGKLFYRLVEQATQMPPTPYKVIVGGKKHQPLGTVASIG
jgi:transposase-like protein/ribosomal protein L37AE/L43A